ncbi:MAG: family 20 glycosylhydrolase, partial [Spirochaetales bacterium]|nr:family 20 glycosylhydrolase [Spirochaetales bacterium]
KSNLECGNLNIATVKDFYFVPLYPEGLKEEEKKFILGGQANLWTEKIENMRQAEYLMFPRLIAYFDALTNYSKRDWKEFKSHKREILHSLIDSNIACYPGEWE